MKKIISEKQRAHLENARSKQDGSWRNKDGAPTKWKVVKDWQAKNPNGTKYQCQKETGLSLTTVYKWWDDYIDPGLRKQFGMQKSIKK